MADHAASIADDDAAGAATGASGGGSSSSGSSGRFSCLTCRVRKLKCGREQPVCTRCARSRDRCEYPSTRKRPVIVATRPRVKELEAKLKHLESRINSAVTPPDDEDSPSSNSSADLIGTGRLEQLPPQGIMEELTNVFFARAFCESAMLHPGRYIASLHLPSHMQPPMCLQYIIMALGAMLSPEHAQLALPFYQRARHYVEVDEMTDSPLTLTNRASQGDGQNCLTVAHVQTFVLLGYFEVQYLWFSRSCMSGCRAVRLAQILGLDRLDGKSGQRVTIPPPRDWCEAEERRRTFWTVFILDRQESSTTDWFILIDWRRIKTRLPASDEAFQLGIDEPSVTIHKALRYEGIQTSTFAWRIVITHLFHECLELSNSTSEDADEDDEDAAAAAADPEQTAFWARHQHLDGALSAALQCLPAHLRSSESTSSSQAAILNVLLHLACICLHRAGAAMVKRLGQPIDAFWRTQARLVPAAQEIFTIVAIIGDIDARFRNPFVPFAAFMAASVFLEHYLLMKDASSEERLSVMMALMISVGQHNPVTASLAVQLAHQVKKSGIDPSALDKVNGLMGDMDPSIPLLAEEDGATGSVLFCPFEKHDHPPPPQYRLTP